MSEDLLSNRRAGFDYEILETFEAGIVLQGTEVKSLREKSGSLLEAHVKAEKEELWLYGASIIPYKFGNIHNHEEKRKRKLLLHKKEIERIARAIQEKGLTVIALSMYLKAGKVKVKLALARGKKQFDKRLAVKERDEKRQMERLKKEYR